MTKAEVNDYGQQVYTAEIPANVDGIIFNGNGSQTVDIKEGIADGAQWYTIDEKEGTAYKVVLVGETPTEEATTAETSEEPTTEAAHFNSFYVDFTAVLGQGTNWYAWTWDDDHAGEWRPVEKFGYVSSYENVVFASFNTDVPDWDSKVVQTENIKVEDGNTLYILNEKDENGNLKTSWKAVEDPTEATEPTEEPTEEPGDTITVKFTDALGWGTANVYYWPNGGDWPGSAMTKAEVNDYGQQVYTAEIPANVDGIIFNGNGSQTVDIKEGITDGAQWYTVNEKDGNAYKVVLVGEQEPTEDPTPDPEPQGTTLKFKPNNNWTQANARFAVYVFGDNGDAWADLTSAGDGTYTVTLPDGNWKKVIFVRMNPDKKENNWSNKWNQSNDLDITDGKLYTVPAGVWDNWTA